MLQLLGYNKHQMSALGVDMVMYLGELAANTILDTEDNNINTELEEYNARGNKNNVFSMIKVIFIHIFFCELKYLADGDGQIHNEGRTNKVFSS